MKTGRIPNKLLALFGAAGLLGAFAAGGGSGVLSSLAGAGGMFLLLWILYSLRLMGAGDVKLFMMLGVFCGWPGVLGVFACSIAAGSVYALLRFARRRDFRERFRELGAYLDAVRSGGRPKAYFAAADKGARVSFAVFAAAGMLVCVMLHIV